MSDHLTNPDARSWTDLKDEWFTEAERAEIDAGRTQHLPSPSPPRSSTADSRSRIRRAWVSANVQADPLIIVTVESRTPNAERGTPNAYGRPASRV